MSLDEDFEALKEYINPTWEEEAYVLLSRIRATIEAKDADIQELVDRAFRLEGVARLALASIDKAIKSDVGDWIEVGIARTGFYTVREELQEALKHTKGEA